MESEILVLKSIITDEKKAYMELLKYSEEKKDTLIKNDIAELGTIVRCETEILKKIKLIKKTREASLTRIAEMQGIKQRLVVSDIIKLAKKGLAAELEQIRNEFCLIVQKLADCNELNKKLINTQLEYSAFCIETLSQSMGSKDTYNHSGNLSELGCRRLSLLDQKI